MSDEDSDEELLVTTRIKKTRKKSSTKSVKVKPLTRRDKSSDDDSDKESEGNNTTKLKGKETTTVKIKDLRTTRGNKKILKNYDAQKE